MLKALLLEEQDPFPFVLAEALGKHLHELDEMPNADYVKWAAFFSWRYSRQDFARQVANARVGVRKR